MTRVTLHQELFLHAINKAVNLASKNAVESVQSGIKLTVDDKFVYVEASSIDAHLRYAVALIKKSESTKNSLAVVAPEILKDQVRVIREKEIDLEFQEDSIVIHASGKYRILSHRDAEFFPPMESVAGSVRKVSCTLFRRGLERVYPCLSTNPSQNYALTGALLLEQEGAFQIYGTDLQSLVQVTVPTLETASPADGQVFEEKRAILPRPVVSLLLTLRSEEIEISIDDRYLHVVSDPIEITAVLIASEYPSLDGVLNSIKPNATTTVNVFEFLTALQRIEPIAKVSEGVRFTVNTPNSMSIETTAEGRGQAQVKLDCDSDTPGVSTILALPSMIQFLRHVIEAKDRKVQWIICKPLSNRSAPTRLLVLDDVLDFTYLIMPMAEI